MTSVIPRDTYMDFMRSIGLISIILVHCTDNEFVLKINLFNVPLMVFVSGLVASPIALKDIKTYYWKRIKRLLIPTYAFLCFFLLFLFILKCTGLANIFEFNVKNVFFSFLLLDKTYGGVGFVWVMRVFLLMMVVSPFVVYLNRTTSDKTYVILMFTIIALQELMCSINVSIIGSVIINQYLLYLVGYLPFLMGGVKIKSCNKRTSVWLIIILVVYLMSVPLCKDSLLELAHKYPPRADYIAYGIVVSILLLFIKPFLKRLAEYRFFIFIGRNTMWIYWWHVPVVLSLNSMVSRDWWIVSFILVLSLACTMYYFQSKIVQRINKQFINKYFL